MIMHDHRLLEHIYSLPSVGTGGDVTCSVVAAEGYTGNKVQYIYRLKHATIIHTILCCICNQGRILSTYFHLRQLLCF